MIVRMWRGRTKVEDADRYLLYLQETGLKDYAVVEGNLGVQALRRVDGDVAEFLIVTHWDSMEAVKRFAGPNPEVSVYYPEDDAYLLEKEPNVIHYEVAYQG